MLFFNHTVLALDGVCIHWHIIVQIAFVLLFTVICLILMCEVYCFIHL